jgi:hypothetical protein
MSKNFTDEEKKKILLFYREIKNKAATVKNFGISLCSLNKIIENSEKIFDNKTTKEIRELSEKMGADKDLFFYYVADLFGLPVEDICFYQAAKMIAKGYTYRGMYLTLKYFYEIKKGNKEKANKTIGIIPYVYEEAKRHYSSKEYKKINIEKEIAEYVEKKREIIKTNPSLHYAYSSKRNKKKIKISEME